MGSSPHETRVVAGRYRLVRELGRGGMGTVYVADQLAVDRRVAVKLLRPELALDPTMVARFRREAKAASRIRSPHVVTLFDFGEDADGTMFLAMELLAGQSLQSLIDARGAIPVPEALRIGVAIARALEAAHTVGVVHRDLKPDNVLVGDDGTVKVLDFGIAKIVDADEADAERADAQLTQAGAIVGTPMYMSPEAVARRAVGPAADLYALGAILFQVLVGRPVFVEREPVLLMGMHLRLAPELLREAAPSLAVPDALEEIVDALLAKDPGARPESAARVASMLESLVDAPATVSGERTLADVEIPTDPSPGRDDDTARRRIVPAASTPVAVAGRRMRPRVALYIGAAACASVVGVVALLIWPPGGGATQNELRDPARAAQPAASTESTESATPTVPGASIHVSPPPAHELTIVVDPDRARLTFDGTAVGGDRTVRVADDGLDHVIEARADGYVTKRVLVRGGGDGIIRAITAGPRGPLIEEIDENAGARTLTVRLARASQRRHVVRSDPRVPQWNDP